MVRMRLAPAGVFIGDSEWVGHRPWEIRRKIMVLDTVVLAWQSYLEIKRRGR